MTASTAHTRRPVLWEFNGTWKQPWKTDNQALTVAEAEALAGADRAPEGYTVRYETAPLTPGTVKPGDGVTFGIGSDAYAGTVTRVSASGKTFWYTLDNARRTDSNGLSESQTYEYTTVPVHTWVNVLGRTETNEREARWSEKRQRFVEKGSPRYGGLSRGRRSYQDPSF